MNRNLGSLALALLLVLPLPAARGEEPAPPTRLTASGKVVAADGRPVAGATVYLREWAVWRKNWLAPGQQVKDILARTTTDAQGRFAFRDVMAPGFPAAWQGMSAAPWDVVVLAKGYGVAWQQLAPEGRERSLTLELPAEAKLEGRVLDPQERPVPGARVQVAALAPLGSEARLALGTAGYLDLQWSELPLVTVTDREGHFLLGGLPPDCRIHVTISEDRFVRASAYAATTNRPQPKVVERTYAGGKVEVREHPVQTGALTITLQPGHRLRGRVVLDATGKPAAGSSVALWHDGQSFDTLTDAAGHFALKQLPPGRWQLRAAAPPKSEYLGTQLDVAGGADRPDVEVEVKLPRGALVSGQVVNEETGKGVAGVTVVYQGAAPTARAFALSAQSEADGRFRLAGPPGPGRLRITAVPSGYYLPMPLRGAFTSPMIEQEQKREAPFVREVSAKLDQPVSGLKFMLGRGLVLTGRVLDPQGKPVGGARVERRALFSRSGSPVVSDAAGRFTLSGLPPDQEQELIATHPGRRLAAQLSVPAPHGKDKPAPVEIRLLPMAAATGRVLDEDRRPIANTSVSLLVKHTDQNSIYYTSQAAAAFRSDREGRFTVENLTAGASYMLQVTADGYAGAQSPEFTARSDQPYRAGDLTLTKADQSVAGVVVDPAGRPLEGVRIYGYPRRPGVTLTRFENVATDKEGRFRLDHLPRGPFHVTAQLGSPAPKPGGMDRFTQMTVEAGKQDARLVLFVPPPSPAASVGKPAPEFAVRRWFNGPEGSAGAAGFAREAFRGRVVLLAFLDEAKPSHRLLPLLNRLHEELSRKGLAVVRVYESADEEELGKRSRTPAALAAPALTVGYSEAFLKYGVRATPTLFLIDRQGVLRQADVAPDELEAQVEKLLK